MAAVTEDPKAVISIDKIASKKGEDLKEMMMVAVTQNGLALEFVNQTLFAPEDKQELKEMVMAAVTQNGLALKFVDKTLFTPEDKKTK